MKLRFATKTPAWIALGVCILTSSAFAAKIPTIKSTIETLSGPVTEGEINSFKTAIAAFVPGDSNKGNHYSYGNGGDAMEACGDMYDMTKDIAILDKFIVCCDKVVSIRNTTKVMWTGKIDPVWQNNANNTIWGCEQGDVAGHLAFCAQLIAQNPTIWNLPVGIGDPQKYGVTYKARAEKYLEVVDQTMDLFYANNFIHTDEFMQTPGAPKWPDPHSANDPVPWNQQAMICSALVRGADAHALFRDNSPNIVRFRNTAKASTARFFTQCKVFQYEKNGMAVCKWSYSGNTFEPGSKIHYAEDVAHGGYDIVLVWRAYHWLPGAVSTADAKMLADTLMEAMKTNNQFWSHVDASGGLKKTLKNSWVYLAEWRPDAYKALVTTGSEYYCDAARKIWIRNAMAKGWPPATPSTATPKKTTPLTAANPKS